MSSKVGPGFQSLGAIIAAYESLEALLEAVRRQSGISLAEDGASYIIRPQQSPTNRRDGREMADN